MRHGRRLQDNARAGAWETTLEWSGCADDGRQILGFRSRFINKSIV